MSKKSKYQNSNKGCIISIFIIMVIIITISVGISNNSSTNTTSNIPQNITSNNTSDISTTWNKTAGETNGYDWETMNDAQKEDIVLGVLQTLKDNGSTVDVNSKWFIDGLNGYYGTSVTNKTTLNYAISLIGVTGGVLHN